MKLSKLFHTLYATLMALPVLIIPIFALNILHKETEPISIEVQEKVSVDFNQLVKTTSLTGTRTTNGVTFTNNNDGSFTVNGTSTNYFDIQLTNAIPCLANNTYFARTITGGTGYLKTWLQGLGVEGFTEYLSVRKENDFNISIYFTCYANQEYDFVVYPQIYNVTQMFGNNREPSTDAFQLYFNRQYYPYTESQEMLIDVGVATLNNTDIGSQFVYALYKPVNDYFNFGEFFGLSGMYDWFQLNIFNGTAPISFFIVFNVMIYWLFISLFWLLFDILIYVPMVIHKWLDKAEM